MHKTEIDLRHDEDQLQFFQERILAEYGVALGGLGEYSGRIRLLRPAPNGARTLSFHMSLGSSGVVLPSDTFQSQVSEISPHSRSESKKALYGLGFLAVTRIADHGGGAALTTPAMPALANEPTSSSKDPRDMPRDLILS